MYVRMLVTNTMHVALYVYIHKRLTSKREQLQKDQVVSCASVTLDWTIYIHRLSLFTVHQTTNQAICRMAVRFWSSFVARTATIGRQEDPTESEPEEARLPNCGDNGDEDAVSKKPRIHSSESDRNAL